MLRVVSGIAHRLVGPQLALLARVPSFRLLALANFGSGVGTWLAFVALTVDIWDRTESGMWVAALLIADFLPVIVIGVLAGADHTPLDVEILEALLGAGREPSATGDEGRLRNDLAERAPELTDLGQQEADVDRAVSVRRRIVDDDAVVDDSDSQSDDVGLQALGCGSGSPDRVLSDEVRIEDLDLCSRALRGGTQTLQSVGRDWGHPLKGIGMDQQGPKARPGGGRPGGNGHVQTSVTG